MSEWDWGKESDTHNYVGLTRTTVHNRMEQHIKAQQQKLSSSAMYRHDCDVHNGVAQSYSTKIIAKEKRIVRLYCSEALHIERQDRQLSINVKMEGGRTNSGVVRIRATREHTWTVTHKISNMSHVNSYIKI